MITATGQQDLGLDSSDETKINAVGSKVYHSLAQVILFNILSWKAYSIIRRKMRFSI